MRHLPKGFGHRSSDRDSAALRGSARPLLFLSRITVGLAGIGSAPGRARAAAWSAILNQNSCSTSEPPSFACTQRRVIPHDPPDVLDRFHEALPLVRGIAKKLRQALTLPIDIDELAAYGQSGLLEAARRYEPAREVPFGAFARFRIRGAMLDGIRQSARLPRRVHERLRASQRAASSSAVGDLEESGTDHERRRHEDLAGMATAIANGLLFDAVQDEQGDAIAVDRNASPEDQYQRSELLAAVLRAIEQLPAGEALVIRGMYFHDQRIDDLAEELGSSSASTCRLHTSAIRRLTRRLSVTAPRAFAKQTSRHQLQATPQLGQ